MMSEKFTFDEKQFEFNVQHHSDDNATFIECIHNEDYYAWSLSMNEKTNSESNKYLKFPITPQYLYKLLFQYKEGLLDKIYEFKFPESYKDPTSNIMFELCIKLPYDDNLVDIIPFFLEPSVISDSDRFNKKLLNLKESMVAEKKNELESLKDELVSLKNEFVSLKDKYDNLSNFLENYVTKDELEKELDAMTNETETQLGTTLINYATKEELSNHATNCAFANNEIKADLNKNYVGKDALVGHVISQFNDLNKNYVSKGTLLEEIDRITHGLHNKYVPKIELTSILHDYPTKYEVANTYATVHEVTNNYATKSELDNYVVKT